MPFIKKTSFPIRPPKPYIIEKKIDEATINSLFDKINSGSLNDIIKFMLNNNTILNVRSLEDNKSLLHAVIQTENPFLTDDDKYYLIKFLLNNGISVGLYDTNNITPLHLAAKAQNYILVKLLLENGAEVNRSNNQNMIPLHYAIQSDIFPCRSIEKVKNLVSIDSQPTTENLKKLTTVLIDLLNDKPFKKHITHISNTLSKMNTMYLKSISNIHLSLKDELIKSNNIKNIDHQFYKKLYINFKNKLTNSLDTIDKNQDDDKSWGPGKTTNILPDIIFTETLHKQYISQIRIFDTLSKHMTNINDNNGVMSANIRSMFICYSIRILIGII